MNLREYYIELKGIPRGVKQLQNITDDNAKSYYDKRHTWWLINHSDIVKGDGVELTKAERAIKIPLGVFNEVYACETIEGLPLRETNFISQEIDIYNKLKELVKNEIRPIYLMRVETYLKYLANRYNELTNQPKQQKKTSYVWQGNADIELPELYRLMIESNLIAKETTYEQFKAVFTGQPIDNIEKIRKTKKFTNVLLTYFISELFQKSNPNDYLSIAESCFDGAKNLSQAQTNYINNQNRLPRNHIIIDDLLKRPKKPL